MFRGVMYVFGGFDGAKRNDIYRILFDEEERRRNLQDYELKQLARSCSLMNLSMDDAMMGGNGDEMGSAAHSDLLSNHHQAFYPQHSLDIVGGNMVQHSMAPVTLQNANHQR